MPVTTRSQTIKISSNTATMLYKNDKVPRNAKGYPSVGQLSLKPSVKPARINPYINNCSSLEMTANTFSCLNEMINYVTFRKKIDKTEIKQWRDEVYNKLYDYVDLNMDPTFEEIDAMLLVCDILLRNKNKRKLEEFILNCPKKFIMTYSNNSERTPSVLYQLHKIGLHNVRSYLIGHIHETKLKTWNERQNAHLRGNNLLECTA